MEQTSKMPSHHALYLEDNTPVRAIKINHLPTDASSEYLKGYFENASGPVDYISIVSQSANNNDEMVAYVTFRVPEDAAKLICNPSQRIRFIVKQAENDFQPKLDPNSLKLDQINDDCLSHIISFLDMADIVNLGETCVRFHSVTQYCRKYENLSFGANTGDLSINEATLPAILTRFGSFIKTIECHRLNSNILDILLQYCPNITAMKIINPCQNLTGKDFKRNKLLFKKLTILEINNAELYDNSLIEICWAAKLKSLTLKKCCTKGTFLNKLDKLKVLIILDCPTNPELIIFCMNKNKLRSFATDARGSLDALKNIKKLRNIQELQIDISPNNGNNLLMANLRYLTKIKKIKLTQKYSQAEYRNLNNIILTLSGLKTLKSLDIEHISINDETLKNLNIMSNLNSLRLICENTIGQRFYRRIDLPNLKELKINVPNGQLKEHFTSMCKMVVDLQHLDCFSCNVQMPLLLELLRSLTELLVAADIKSPIKIAIEKIFVDLPEVQHIAADNKEIITLLDEETYSQ